MAAQEKNHNNNNKAPTFSHQLLALVPELVQHFVELGAVRPDLHVHQLVEHGVQKGFVRVERACGQS